MDDFISEFKNVEDESVNRQITDDIETRKDIKFKYTYPDNPNYEYVSYSERINFDDEKNKDIQRGEGFIISSPKATIKKDIKNPNGIFSTKFGQRLGDANPYIDRYKCSCGKLRGKINNGVFCEACQTICREVDDDFHMFGWIVINPEYHIIHPDLFKQLNSLFGRSKYSKDKRNSKGSVLWNILDYDKEIDQDGYEIGPKIKPGEPFYGIGMIDFYNRFDEIMEYYIKKNKSNKAKAEIIDDIIKDKDKIFCHSIPVFTTQLRPVDISESTMYYESTNGYYRIMTSLAQCINKNKRKIDRTAKLKNNQLFRLQTDFMKLYDECIDILSGKKGELRSLVSGRFGYASRSVIRQDPDLRIDQVKLPYIELLITYQQPIINMLHRIYNISYQEGYDKWFSACSNEDLEHPDTTMVRILMDLINNSCGGEGLPVIINRNPTIAYGSIMQMYCIGINYNFTMSVPLQILPPLAADFDGDVLNVFHIINKAFYERAREVFNPRNAMYISKNNGMFNLEVMVQRDTLINANTLNDLTFKKYSAEELSNIERIKAKQQLA